MTLHARRDPQAVAAYRRALFIHLNVPEEKLRAMTDDEVIAETERIMDGLVKTGAAMARTLGRALESMLPGIRIAAAAMAEFGANLPRNVDLDHDPGVCVEHNQTLPCTACAALNYMDRGASDGDE